MKRSYSAEIIDDFSIQDSRIDEALGELKVINYFLGGISATKEGINEILSRIAARGQIKILDVGSGASDNLRYLNKYIKGIRLFSVDLNMRACRYIKSDSGEGNVVCSNALKLPFKNNSFDIANASLFLHHFNGEEIVKILKELLNLTENAIIINDLRRSVAAYLGIKALTAIFSKSKMVKNDAPLSVRRGFKKDEIIKIINELGITDFSIRRKWAFRWLVVIYKSEQENE